MMSVIRKSLVIVLAMLQLLAPLVHAHAGQTSFNEGLHVPGLELYLPNQDAPVFQGVSADWNSEGILIVVDTGIKNSQDIFVEIEDDSFALLPSGQLQVSALPDNDRNFPPPPESFHFRRQLSTFSPRAPPAQ
jgi:hypothetical protein